MSDHENRIEDAKTTNPEVVKAAIQKTGLGFAIGAFAFMVFGSILTGARFMTSLIRGFEGALVFGVLAFVLSWRLLNEEEETTSTPLIAADEEGADQDRGIFTNKQKWQVQNKPVN